VQAHYKDEIARYEKEKGEIQTEAKSLESEYE
jgi:Skp family chaperone for outer membrane proteins